MVVCVLIGEILLTTLPNGTEEVKIMGIFDE